MAKSDHVTEDQMAHGLAKSGGFASLVRASSPKRDNPFSFRAQIEPSSSDSAAQGVESKLLSGGPVPEEQDSSAVITTQVKVDLGVLDQPSSTNSVSDDNPERESHPKVVRKTRATAVQSFERAEISFDKVTVLVEPSLRDRVQSFANALQRSRTSKVKRITANTVYRPLILAALEAIETCDLGVINSEEELLRAIRGRLRK